MEQAVQRAIDSYQKDARFRAIAQSVVARVMSDHGPVNPERADAEAHDIALRVAVLLLQRVFEEDAELSALRTERDHYKQAALRFAKLTPVPLVLAGPQELTEAPAPQAGE